MSYASNFQVLHSFFSSVPYSIIAVFFHFLGSLFSVSVQIIDPNVLNFQPPFTFAISTPISVRSVGNFNCIVLAVLASTSAFLLLLMALVDIFIRGWSKVLSLECLLS
ncbi:hypothetical protein ES288_D10G188800v1 [Gossypium darwinii]|uniref:Uncharacterized protein n=1 Tax=Gossypium darwinii TaxID=34276 RepID=A0A5D2AZZ6_GOSDA|nr:hypothetical protein ES288_D10G188800v1 [Gossypium darwinii]